MLWILHKLWAHRTAILLGIQLLSALRKTAKEVAREYIRRRIRERLRRQVIIVTLEIGAFLLALYFCVEYPSLESRLFASGVLWCVTLYNVNDLFFTTIPELRALYKLLKGKVGFTIKYFLEVSLVTELMQLNVIFLSFCLIAGISSRTMIGLAFSYTQPWVELMSPR